MLDDRRFETAWRTYGPSILRYCRFATGSRECGEDVASETFARLLQRGAGLPDDKVEAWLFTVARNLCRSQQRREGRFLGLLPQLRTADEVAPDPERNSELAALLAPLDPDARLAVYLRVIEDRPFAEVARLTGRRCDAVKKCVYRALAQLRSVERQSPMAIPQRGGVEHE